MEVTKVKYESAYLAHHGILGMKWGVRRFQNEDGTLTDKGKKRYHGVSKIGDDAYIMVKNKSAAASREYQMFKGNKRIGYSMVDDYDDHSHIDWIGLKGNNQGKGYGQASLKRIIDDSVSLGKKYITLDAAGLDPRAQHIYEKAGFKAISSIESDLWDGLVLMRKDL